MSDERTVAALRALARESSALRPSAGIEEQLLAAFDAHHGGSRPGRRGWVTWVGAAAAVAVFAAGLALAQREVGRPGLKAGTPDVSNAGPINTPGSDEAPEFIPWPGAAALPSFESGQIVRTELPASVLPLLGIPRADAPAGDRVVADVLYAQDGLARAVRIVRDQSMNP